MDGGSESSGTSPDKQITSEKYVRMLISFATFGKNILAEKDDTQRTSTPLFLRRGSGPSGKPLESAFCALLWKHADDVEAFPTETCSQCKLVRYCDNLCLAVDTNNHRELCQFVLSRELFSSSLPKTFARLPTLSNPPFPVYGLLQDIDGSPSDSAGPLFGSAARRSSPRTSKPSVSFPARPKLPKHLRFLFSCAYDLRNVLLTVCQIPESYKHRVTLFINSAECILAVRDILILEILRQHGPDGIDAAIALWFSTALTTMQDFLVLKAIRRLTRSNESSNGMVHGARYQREFSCSSTASFLRAELNTSVMCFLHAIASTINENFDPTRQYWEREEERSDKEVKKACALAAHLASWSNYSSRGILLPFGAWDAHFLKPNRLRYSTSMDFIARYRNDVLCGWNMQQVIATGVAYGASPMDLYGCLFFHVRALMETFLRRIASCVIELHITQFEPGRIAEIFQESGMKFHRIDACPLAHYSISHSRASELSVDPELPIDVRRYLRKLEKCVSKQYPRTSTLSDTVDAFGRLLENDTSAAWPSLLLTASLDWATKERREQLRNLVTAECGSDHEACLSAQYAKDRYPNMMCCMKDLLGEHFSNFVKEWGADHERTKLMSTGLERKSEHRIISPNCIPVQKTTPASDAEKSELHYFNLLFSGFTFLEQFQEWGWPSAKGTALTFRDYS